MRHIQAVLVCFLIVFTHTSNAEQHFDLDKFEQQVEKTGTEVKFSLTQELSKVFSFFKTAEQKANKYRYQVREGIDDIIYDSQVQNDNPSNYPFNEFATGYPGYTE